MGRMVVGLVMFFSERLGIFVMNVIMLIISSGVVLFSVWEMLMMVLVRIFGVVSGRM